MYKASYSTFMLNLSEMSIFKVDYLLFKSHFSNENQLYQNNKPLITLKLNNQEQL